MRGQKRRNEQKSSRQRCRSPGRISPLSLQETVEPEGKLDKAERPPEPPQNPFLLDIGQSRIYSTRIAGFNAGRINFKSSIPGAMRLTFVGIFCRDLLSLWCGYDYYFVLPAGRKGSLDKGGMRPVRRGAGQNRYLFDFPLIFCLMMSSE